VERACDQSLDPRRVLVREAFGRRLQLQTDAAVP
jgi:hypothetical protein